ncbi:MAG TPA: glycosyltransferase family 39 protein, partial [Aggregatilineales bacterium]|nr:glycosyltransferase family 39 protein [Aggregatilineales bacterium]
MAHKNRSAYTLPVLAGLMILAFLLRFVGINWDDHSHLHPDERFMTSIASSIGDNEFLTGETSERCPDAEGSHEYFNTACSNLNPNNISPGSYVYGTLPLFIVRGVATLMAEISDTDWLNYDYIHFIGRGVNAFADMLSVFFVFLIGRRLFSSRHGLIAAGLYTTAVLPIQLSHFWTVDIQANLFFMIGLYAAVEISVSRRMAAWAYLLFGLALGCALASRINLFPMALLLPGAAILNLYQKRETVNDARGWMIRAMFAVILMVMAFGIGAVGFRVFQPYAFTGPEFSDWEINPKWLRDTIDVGNFSRAYDESWPPSNQWVNRIPYAYAWFNMAVWGMGLIPGIVATI